MEDLLKVDFDNQTVSARDLYDVLSVDGGTKGTERFSKWFDRYCSYGFEPGIDYSTPNKKVRVQTEGTRTVQREVDDYDLSVDMAKQVCMLQRTEKGMKLRQYFIDLEKAWNTPDQIFARALKMADQTIRSLKIDVQRMKPKEEFFDAVADSKTAVSMKDVANVLAIKGYGRNNLFEFLRNKGILNNYNRPYQRYIDNGWFRVIEQRYTKNGEECVTFKTLVYQKGIDAIRKILEKEIEEKSNGKYE